MRHPIILAALGLVIAIVATSGIAALPWASNEGCADAFGTRDADVSLQLVPFGLVCDYEADLTGPAEKSVRASSVPLFVAWLLFIGAAVTVGLRRRAIPAARAVVSGICVLGAFGVLATFWEMSGAMAATILWGVAVSGIIDVWLWPATGRWGALLSTAALLPLTVIATWFVPGLMGANALAVALGLAAAAAMASVCSRAARTFVLPAPFEPL